MSAPPAGSGWHRRPPPLPGRGRAHPDRAHRFMTSDGGPPPDDLEPRSPSPAPSSESSPATRTEGEGEEVGVGHGRHICRPSGAFFVFLTIYLGLTPQAKYLSPLRGSRSEIARSGRQGAASEALPALVIPSELCESRDPPKLESDPSSGTLSGEVGGSFDSAVGRPRSG